MAVMAILSAPGARILGLVSWVLALGCGPAASTPTTGAAGGTIWDRMCAAVPGGVDSKAAIAAMAAVPGAQTEVPELFEVLEVSTSDCDRLNMFQVASFMKTKAQWTCPALLASLDCDPQADLVWICDRAREFVSVGADKLTPEDQRSFGSSVMRGILPRPPGTTPPPQKSVLYEIDDRPVEHRFHPDFKSHGESGCKLTALIQARAQAIGFTGWTCPDLGHAVGCVGEGAGAAK